MPSELDLGEPIAEGIAKVLESFSEKEGAGKQSLSQLLAANPRAFAPAAISVLAHSKPSPGSRYLVHLLTKEKTLPAVLLDHKTNGRAAVAALRTVAGNGTNLQPVLELTLNRALQDLPSHENSARILRLLELLAAIAPPSLWNSFQLELMAHSDKIVRSKATLLIGRSTKNAAWIGRRFMDRDARVQASAVEALWELEAAESKPLLMTASKSRYNRVVANAVLGLYRIAEPKAVGMLLDMLRHEDPAFQLSGLWAMGETQDPRFLPALMDHFKTSQGKVRLAATRSLARIRRREKKMAEAGTLSIHFSQAAVQQDGRRHLAFTLSSQPPIDLAGLKKMAFAVWEGKTLIQDYEVKAAGNPAVLADGFLAPRFDSSSDPYALAITEALTRCHSSKRPDDLWRIDRYSTLASTPDAKAAEEQSTTPADEKMIPPEAKAKQGFLAGAEALAKIIASEPPPERAAPDAFQDLQRLSEALGRLSGKRHLFVLLHESQAACFEEPEPTSGLKNLLSKSKIVLHGFAVGLRDASAFRGLCLAIPEGTFLDTTVDELPAALEGVYSHLLNGFELGYQLPPGTDPGPVTLKVSSGHGAGKADVTLQPHTA